MGSNPTRVETTNTPSSYSTCPGLSIKWTGRRFVTDSGTKCAWVIHESKAVQIQVHHSNPRCLYVPRVPGSVKNPHNNNNHYTYYVSFRQSLSGVDLTVSERDLQSRSSSELLRWRVRKVSSLSPPFFLIVIFCSGWGSSGTIGVSFVLFLCN